MLPSLAFLYWLTNEDSLTAATWGLVIGTFLLVVATVILYFDSRAKGKEQRERWEREDASRVAEQQSRWEREDRLRADDAKPKAVVEIAKRKTAAEIVFSCFNLGDTIFFIDQMIVTVTGGCILTSDLVGPPVLHPGTFVSIPFDCTGLAKNGFQGLQEANAVLVLKGSQGNLHTDPTFFYFYPDPGEAVGYGWCVGPLSDRMPGAMVKQPRSIPEVR